LSLSRAGFFCRWQGTRKEHIPADLRLTSNAASGEKDQRIKLNLKANWNNYFSIVPYFPVEPPDWEGAITLGWLMRDQGLVLPWNDLLIGAVALRRNLRVFARDQHFESLRMLAGLRLYHPGFSGTYSREDSGAE